MSILKVDPADVSMGTLLGQARTEPVILQTAHDEEFAVLPLDEDVLDLLLERNPTFIEECRQIRERMRQGAFVTYEEAVQLLKDA